MSSNWSPELSHPSFSASSRRRRRRPSVGGAVTAPGAAGRGSATRTWRHLYPSRAPPRGDRGLHSSAGDRTVSRARAARRARECTRRVPCRAECPAAARPAACRRTTCPVNTRCCNYPAPAMRSTCDCESCYVLFSVFQRCR